MRVVHRRSDVDEIIEIEIDDGSTVRDLQQVLGVVGPGLCIDDRFLAADAALPADAIYEGSLVETGTPAPGPADAPSALMVTVSGGLRAGARFGIDGAVLVGRSPLADVTVGDPTVAPRHVVLRPEVAVAASGVPRLLVHPLDVVNRATLEGRPLEESAMLVPGCHLRLGATRLRVDPAVDDRPHAIVAGLGAHGGVVPFNRPPRHVPAELPPPMAAPGPVDGPPASEPLSVAGIVLPIVAGAIVALLFSPLMAVFAALGPAVTIGTWWERRRRRRHEHRQAVAAHDAAVDALADLLTPHRHRSLEALRDRHPDPGEVIRRACGPSVRVWERRSGDPDAFVVGLGTADRPHEPALVVDDAAPAAAAAVSPEAWDLVAVQPRMPDVPVPLDLGPGRVVGIVGPVGAARAAARSLVLQMATHHGPAGLAIAVAVDEPDAWAWCRWLPHTMAVDTGVRGAYVGSTVEVHAVDAAIAARGDRALLAVIEGDDPLQGRATAGRRLLGAEGVSALVIVRDRHRLPAGCDQIVVIDAIGRIELIDPRSADVPKPVLAWGLTPTVAERAARRMARLDDPELPAAGAGLPATVSLLSVLGVDPDEPDHIAARWAQSRSDDGLATPIGADQDGSLTLDLVADGPHVLLGGTTGSGKSELLRSFVAGLAASHDPDHCALVLIDYKGGAAFDCCLDLPHVVGVVTDLDDHLAARALRSLEAELRAREERLRSVGADNVAGYRKATGGVPAMPRLVVVVDEFASLATDLPTFLDALVGIAQRGRSLGVHMVLATQRPAGVVTDDIRANTATRIGLRVADRSDSLDILDAADAAKIPRSRPGRALARLGPGELVPFQAALVTGNSGGRRRSVRTVGSAPAVTGPSDLERLVATITAAHQREGGTTTAPPWCAPLPEVIAAADAPVALGVGQWLVVDEPDRQRQWADGWSPLDGHLVVVGGPGAGSSTTLGSMALAITASTAPDRPHLHVIDLDGGHLLALADLCETGTVAGPSESGRRVRLLRWLDEEVARRRRDPDPSAPVQVLVVDDLAGLARAHDPVREADVHDRFNRIWSDGPAVGVVVAVSVRRAADLSAALAATAGEVLLHRTSDPGDGLRFGSAVDTSGHVPGRAVRVGDGNEVHVVRFADTLPEAVAARGLRAVPEPAPHDVGELSSCIDWSQHPGVVERRDDGTTAVAVAVGESDLSSAPLLLHAGEHAVILGPARSGRTTVLRSIARAAKEHGIATVSVGRGAELGPVIDAGAVGDLDGHCLVLIDDVLAVDDPSGSLGRLLAAPPPGVHVIASASPDRFRSAYTHWSNELRFARRGFLLRPEPIDGDLLGVTLPPRLSVPARPGSGLLVADGIAVVVQLVTPDDQPSAG